MINMEEIWKKIKGYPDYYVSNFGRVKSYYGRTNGEVLQGHLVNSGYKTVALYTAPKTSTRKSIHRLVAEAFIPNPENKPQVNHIDGDRFNNAVTNLEWVTCSENTQHAYDKELESKGEGRYNAKLTWDIVNEIRENPEGRRPIHFARKYGVSKSLITRVRKYKTWKSEPK